MTLITTNLNLDRLVLCVIIQELAKETQDAFIIAQAALEQKAKDGLATK
jgi:hypothetical protein